jgi:hypothetical protein
MVNFSLLEFAARAAWLAQQPPTQLQLLDPATRLKLMAALMALVILGFTMILLTWLAGRAVRRYMNTDRGRTSGRPRALDDDDDWARKPLNPE